MPSDASHSGGETVVADSAAAGARLDALPWSRWHWRVIVALGVAWLLDGLEVTVVGSLGTTLQRSDTLALSAAQVGISASFYVGGAVIGALLFGRLADYAGRKKLFLVTLGVYTVATTLTGLSPDFTWFAVCRAATGLGIGGEYAAINSAIDELIPARFRGTADLGVNSTFWIGAVIGSLLSVLMLDPRVIAPRLGWRLMFVMGAILGLAVILVRRHLPESPRWLARRGHVAEAARVLDTIERQVLGEASPNRIMPRSVPGLPQSHVPPWRQLAHVLLVQYRSRFALSTVLMLAQAFFYNAIFFTYSLVLATFYDVPSQLVGTYLIPFAVANFVGPLALGWLFDRARRQMIGLTYFISGLLLLSVGYAFTQDWLTAKSLTLGCSVVFFFASAAASSAYLTASELFPLEIRAFAISAIYAAGTAAGGFVAPALFGLLVQSGRRWAVFDGYALGSFLMIVAAAVAFRYGVAAQGKSLEELAGPVEAKRAPVTQPTDT